MRKCLATMLTTLALSGNARAGEASNEKQRCPRPAVFATVLSFGYAGDHMPRDDARASFGSSARDSWTPTRWSGPLPAATSPR